MTIIIKIIIFIYFYLDNDENFSQAATRQKFIERLNLQNVINNPDDDDKKTKNKHEKVELTTDTIPVMFRGQFVDKKGKLFYFYK